MSGQVLSGITLEVMLLLHAGESPCEVSRRIDRTPDSIARALHRAGLTVYARAFWHEAYLARERVT